MFNKSNITTTLVLEFTSFILFAIGLLIYISNDDPKIPSITSVYWSFSSSLLLVLANILKSASGNKGIDLFSPYTSLPVVFIFILGAGSLRYILEDRVNVDLYYLIISIALFSYYKGVWTALQMGHATKEFKYKRIKFIILFVFIGLASVSALAILVAKVGIPFLYADKIQGRVEARQIVSSWVIYVIRDAQFLLYFYAAYISIFIDKAKFKHKLTILLIAIAVVLINLAPGWRGPVFIILLNCVIIYHYYRRRFSAFKLISISLLAAFIMLAWGFFRLYTSPDGSESLDFLSNYADDVQSLFIIWSAFQFSVYPLGALTILDIFPDSRDFLTGGVLLMTFATALPGKQETLGEVLQEWAPFSFIGDGLNPTIIGEAFADFGIVGVLVYMYLYGFLLGRLYIRCTNSGSRDPINVIVYAYFLTSLTLGTLTGVLSQASYLFHAMVLGGIVLWLRTKHSQ